MMAEMRVLLEHIDCPKQCQLSVYEKNGGYQTLKQVIPAMEPAAIVECVKQSGLRGRGGAGFLTGQKWSFLPPNRTITYLVCNSDESEPGSFKDRLIIERDPHQLIEGIIIASYAILAEHAFIYCRGEFFEGIAKLRQAIKEVKERGYLGKNIFGTNYNLEIIVHTGAGSYMAGEETAQLNSIEGFRATPRLRPPFPAVAGLYGSPTIVNNVETLCNVVHIVKHGATWYQGIGTVHNRGTKIFQVSGQVQAPGCYEFPMGISLRSVLEHAGGMFPNRTFKACYPGGSSCALLTRHDLDICMDFDTLTARKSALGTASIIVFDDSTDMVKVAERLMEFYQDESCGKCTPCREGTRWTLQMLQRICAGGGTWNDLTVIDQICHHMAATSFCAFAAGAAPPIISAIAEFKDEFISYIKRNPAAGELPPMSVAYPYKKSLNVI